MSYTLEHRFYPKSPLIKALEREKSPQIYKLRPWLKVTVFPQTSTTFCHLLINSKPVFTEQSEPFCLSNHRLDVQFNRPHLIIEDQGQKFAIDVFQKTHTAYSIPSTVSDTKRLRFPSGTSTSSP